MAIEGIYNITIESPFGAMSGKLTLKVDKNFISGVCSTRMGTQSLAGTIVSAQEFTCSTKVNSPLGEIDLQITGKVAGDEISGQARAGNFGSFPFKGKKD